MNFNYVFMPIIIFVAGVFIVWLSSRRILAFSKKTYPAWRRSSSGLFSRLSYLRP